MDRLAWNDAKPSEAVIAASLDRLKLSHRRQPVQVPYQSAMGYHWLVGLNWYGAPNGITHVMMHLAPRGVAGGAPDISLDPPRASNISPKCAHVQQQMIDRQARKHDEAELMILPPQNAPKMIIRKGEREGKQVRFLAILVAAINRAKWLPRLVPRPFRLVLIYPALVVGGRSSHQVPYHKSHRLISAR